MKNKVNFLWVGLFLFSFCGLFSKICFCSQKEPSFSRVFFGRVGQFFRCASPVNYYKQRTLALEESGLQAIDPKKKGMSQEELTKDLLAPEHVQNYLKQVWNEQHKISPDSFCGKVLGKINPNHNYPKVIQVKSIESTLRNGQETSNVSALHEPGRIFCRIWKKQAPDELSVELKGDICHESRHDRQISSYFRYLYITFLEFFGGTYEDFYYAEYDAESFRAKKMAQQLVNQGGERKLICDPITRRLEDHPYTYGFFDTFCKELKDVEVLRTLGSFRVTFEQEGYQVYTKKSDYDGDQTFRVTKESLKNPLEQNWKTRYAEFRRLSKLDQEEDFEVPLW